MSHVPFDREIVMPGEELPNAVELALASKLAVDVETKPAAGFERVKKAGLHPWRSELLGFSIAVPGRSWYLPLRHRAPGSERFNLNPDAATRWLKDVLGRRGNRVLINHNLKFDLKCLARAGVRAHPDADLHDTLVAAELLDEREPTHALKPLAEKLLGIPAAEEAVKDRYLADLKQGKDYQDWSYIPADLLAPYACGDAERALLLDGWQAEKLVAEGLTDVWDLERRVTRALVETELRGFRVDVERLMLDKRRFLSELIQIGEKLEVLLGVSINPNSPEELADVLANRLGIPIMHRNKPTDKSPFGAPKFDDDALQDYGAQFPEHSEIFWLVRKSRRLEHMLSSFVDSYLSWRVDDVIHANFNQAAARSGRMTSNEPNVQQVAGEELWTSPEGAEWIAPGARQYFIPRPGKALLLHDYSQIEYRLFAHYANSDRLVEAYRQNPDLDLHQWAADVPLKGLLERKPAKNVNFGIIYGMGKTKLIRSMSTPKRRIADAEGEDILETYYREVPELKQIRREVEGALKRRGFVKTVLGRRRRIEPKYRSLPPGTKTRGLLPYQALNAICQGSGADVLKDRLVAAFELEKEIGADVIVSIHDEIISECDLDRVAEVDAKLRPVLETFSKPDGTPRLRVPIYVGGKTAKSRWSEAETLERPNKVEK